MPLIEQVPRDVLDATNEFAKDLEWGRRLPIYEYHKWWARRYSGIVRLFTIFTTIDRSKADNVDPQEFVEDLYHNYNINDDRNLVDLFSGGGTMVFEGSKVGYQSHGIELNDTACLILESAKSIDRIERIQPDLLEVFWELKNAWMTTCGSCGNPAQIVHTFLAWADNNDDLQIRMNEIKRSRDESTAHYYCQFCDDVLELETETEVCPNCGAEFNQDIDEIEFGDIYPYAEEYYCRSCNSRKVRGLSKANRAGFYQYQENYNIELPQISELNETKRLLSNGFTNFDQLFSNRQLATYQTILDHFRDTELENLARLCVSDAVRSCSYLAQYAPKYRKLTPGFAIKSYWLPPQPVELNPLSFRFTNDGVLFPIGRGNVISTFRRALRASEFSQENGYNFDNLNVYPGAAQTRINDLPSNVDIIFTDPPYANFQYYSDLSLLNQSVVMDRGQFEESVNRLKKDEMVSRNKDDLEEYFDQVTSILSKASQRLNEDRYMLITYHHSDKNVLGRVAEAIRDLPLSLCAVYPVRGESSGRLGNGSKKIHLDLLFVLKNTDTTDSNVYTPSTDACENEHDEELIEFIQKMFEK